MKGAVLFSLTKWYLDCVDADRRFAIAYWSALSWHGFRVAIESVVLHAPGAVPRSWSGASRAAAPEVVNRHVAWRSDAAGVSVNGSASLEPFGLRLLEQDGGTVDWSCQACPAHLRVTLPGGTAVTGLGYVERLAVSIPPWRLPITELRWGRWIAASSEKSIVWIDWRGPDPLTAVFEDGLRSPSAVVDDERIRTGGTALVLSDTRLLHRRTLRDVIGRAGRLTRMLPEPWLEIQDSKWLSHGERCAAGASPDGGWAVHERVRFP